MIEDDDLTNEQANDGSLAEGEQSEGHAKAKAEDKPKTETAEPGAEGEDADGGDDGEEDEDKPKRSRSGTARLKRERDALRQEVELLRSRAAPAADDSAAIDQIVRREIGDPPKETDYADWFAYERALNAYETDKRIVTREVKSRATQAQTAQRQAMDDLVADHAERVAEAVKAIPDFAEVLSKANDRTHPVTPVVERLILQSEKSALLQYHFAKNAADLRRVNGLDALSAAKEVGKLEARLSLAKPSTATRTPPPTNAPKGGASPASQEARMEAYLKRIYGERA